MIVLMCIWLLYCLKVCLEEVWVHLLHLISQISVVCIDLLFFLSFFLVLTFNTNPNVNPGVKTFIHHTNTISYIVCFHSSEFDEELEKNLAAAAADTGCVHLQQKPNTQTAVSPCDIFRDDAHNLPFCQQTLMAASPPLWRMRPLAIGYHSSTSSPLINLCHEQKTLSVLLVLLHKMYSTAPHLSEHGQLNKKTCANLYPLLLERTVLYVLSSRLPFWVYLSLTTIYWNLKAIGEKFSRLLPQPKTFRS